MTEWKCPFCGETKYELSFNSFYLSKDKIVNACYSCGHIVGEIPKCWSCNAEYDFNVIKKTGNSNCLSCGKNLLNKISKDGTVEYAHRLCGNFG